MAALKVAKFGETPAMRCSVGTHLGWWDGAASVAMATLPACPSSAEMGHTLASSTVLNFCKIMMMLSKGTLACCCELGHFLSSVSP